MVECVSAVISMLQSNAMTYILGQMGDVRDAVSTSSRVHLLSFYVPVYVSVSLYPWLTLVIVFLLYTYLISITTQHTCSKKVYWMRFCLLWWCDNLTHTHAYMDTDNIHCNNCSRPDWRLKIKEQTSHSFLNSEFVFVTWSSLFVRHS